MPLSVFANAIFFALAPPWCALITGRSKQVRVEGIHAAVKDPELFEGACRGNNIFSGRRLILLAEYHFFEVMVGNCSVRLKLRSEAGYG